MSFNEEFFNGLVTLKVKTPFHVKDLSKFHDLFEYAELFPRAMELFDRYQEEYGNVKVAFAAVDIYQDKEDARAFLLMLVTLDKISVEDYRTAEQMLMN